MKTKALVLPAGTGAKVGKATPLPVLFSPFEEPLAVAYDPVGVEVAAIIPGFYSVDSVFDRDKDPRSRAPSFISSSSILCSS